MVSMTRRQVLIGGAVSLIVPAIGLAATEKLILSGRVVRNGKPLRGASFTIGGNHVTTDADGRFMTVTDTLAYRAPEARRDSEGTWRATLALAI